MNHRIRNFFRTLAVLGDVLRNMVVDPLRARTELFLEDLDAMLARHGLTLPQLIGYIFGAMMGAMVFAGVIDLVGLIFGQFGYETAARWIILMGTLVGLSGLLPLFTFLHLSRSLFDLVVRGGEFIAEILSSGDDSVPERIRLQLSALRSRRNLTGLLQSLYATYAAVSIGFLVTPTFEGFRALAIATVAVSGIVCLRILNRVKGHGVTRLMMSGCYGFMGGTIVYGILNYIAKPLALSGWPKLSQYGTEANQYIIGFSVSAALITFLVELLTLRLAEEEDEIRNGDVAVRTGHLEAHGVDQATGKLKDWHFIQAKIFNWSWLKSKTLWVVVGVVAMIAWISFRGNPLANLDGFSVFFGIVALVILGIAGAVIYGIVKVVTSQPKPAATSEAHHG